MSEQLVSQSPESLLNVPDVIIITGMSGAGRTVAMHVFEDLGYYVIDNLPPKLIVTLAQIVGINSGVGRHLAIVCDLRSQGLFDELPDVLQELDTSELSYEVVFLDASDEVLRRRYSSLRRRHPIAQDGETTISAIQRERHQLEPVKELAKFIVDTSDLKTADLRARLHRHFSELSDQQLMEVQVFSFGFKYGMPVEADLMIDVRFLPNPFYHDEMRKLTGLDELVANFVESQPQTQAFKRAWFALLDSTMPGYVAEGKTQLSIGVGCTGGQHRSVALAKATADYLKEAGYQVTLTHRDMLKSAAHEHARS